VLAGVALQTIVPTVRVLASLSALGLPSRLALEQTVGYLTICALSYMSARLALILPHISIGGRLEWRAAWQDSRGHFWAIAYVACLASIFPNYILEKGLMFAIGQHFFSTEVAPILHAGLRTLTTAATAAYCGWLYRCYSNELRRSLYTPSLPQA
jgi:hypothetical protein